MDNLTKRAQLDGWHVQHFFGQVPEVESGGGEG